MSLAKALNINYKTTFHWVQSGECCERKRGGYKPLKLDAEKINILCEWIEEDSTISLKQMKNKLFAEFHVTVSTTTIGNCLEGQMYTLKQVHKIPVTMNSQGNKIKRSEYVEQLNEYVSSGHQIVWMDETNFNLFCRRNKGRSRVGNRAILTLPAARGQNIHLIRAISMTGVLKMTTKRG